MEETFAILFLRFRVGFRYFNNQINKDNWLGYKLIAWFTENSIDTENSKFNEIYSGDINELDFFKNKRQFNISRIFFSDIKPIDQLLKILGNTSIPISLFPHGPYLR